MNLSNQVVDRAGLGYVSQQTKEQALNLHILLAAYDRKANRTGTGYEQGRPLIPSWQRERYPNKTCIHADVSAMRYDRLECSLVLNGLARSANE